jgi:hypothetical protein
MLHGHGRRLLELADKLLPEIELAERDGAPVQGDRGSCAWLWNAIPVSTG